MRSTFMGLETGKRALFAQQAGLQTVSQNVANANTPGYSRQRVNFETTASLEFPGLSKSTEAGQLGTGVISGSIERLRESFLDAQFRNESKSSGEWEIRQDTLDKLQAIINEPSDTGISKVINNFFLAWQTLGRNPDKLESRSVVRQSMMDMVAAFNTMDAKLSELNVDIKDNISAKVGEFNTLTSQVVELNKQITTLEVLGDKANDLRDHRDYIVDQLSKLANVTAKELPNGDYQVSVGDTLVINGAAPAVQLTYDQATGAMSFPVNGGQITGMSSSIGEYVSVYRDQLDSLVNGLVNGKMQARLPNDYKFDDSVTTLPFDVTLPDGSVKAKGSAIPVGYTLPQGSVATFEGLNGLHSFGYTMQIPTTQAGALFKTTDGSTAFTAKNIRVSTQIMDDIRNISASYSTYKDANGDVQVKVGSGDVAFMLGEAASASIDFKDGLPPNGAILTKGSITGYMRAMVGQLGAQAQTAERQSANQDALLRQIDGRRQSISGVSLDEEMSNMIRFQQSYAAAARIVSTVDGMLDTIINRMGH